MGVGVQWGWRIVWGAEEETFCSEALAVCDQQKPPAPEGAASVTEMEGTAQGRAINSSEGWKGIAARLRGAWRRQGGVGCVRGLCRRKAGRERQKEHKNGQPGYDRIPAG